MISLIRVRGFVEKSRFIRSLYGPSSLRTLFNITGLPSEIRVASMPKRSTLVPFSGHNSVIAVLREISWFEDLAVDSLSRCKLYRVIVVNERFQLKKRGMPVYH